MTSIASWGNPLVGADQYATLTHSIYTDLSRSFSAVEKSANRLVSEQGDNEVTFDEASPNVLLFKQGDIPRVAISFNSGALLTDSSLIAQHAYSTGFNEHTAPDNELATKYYVDSVAGGNVSEDDFIALTTRVANIEYNYLSKTDTAANTEKLEWESNGKTYSVIPYFDDLLVGEFDGIQKISMRLSPSSILNVGHLQPENSIDFGYAMNGLAKSDSWQATISHVANAQWYNNQNSTPYSDFNKDNIVPTYKVLEDNFAKKSDIIIPDAKSFAYEFTDGENVQHKTRFGYLDDNKTRITYRNKVGDNAETIRCVIDGGSVRSATFEPSTFILFGMNVDGTQSTTKWPGFIMNVANDTWFQNRGTGIYSESNLDLLVPSFKVLEDNYYTKTESDARFINVDKPVELLKRTEVIPITATIPTSNLTCTSTSFSNSYQTINSSYAIKRTGTSHLVSSVSVSVSSGNISDLKLQLYLASGSTYAYTNNGDGTFSIDGDKNIYKSNGEVRLRYAKASSSAADVSFSITAVSISYNYSTTISEYYDKSYVDALEARIAALENANSGGSGSGGGSGGTWVI